jgi:hypothetical protein
MAMGIRTWRTIKLRSDLQILPLRRDWPPQNSQTEPTSTKCSLKSQQGASPKQDCPPTSETPHKQCGTRQGGESNNRKLKFGGERFTKKRKKISKEDGKKNEGFHPPVSAVSQGKERESEGVAGGIRRSSPAARRAGAFAGAGRDAGRSSGERALSDAVGGWCGRGSIDRSQPSFCEVSLVSSPLALLGFGCPPPPPPPLPQSHSWPAYVRRVRAGEIPNPKVVMMAVGSG